jgi:hypothetical protein
MNRQDKLAIALVIGVIALVWLLAHVPAAQSYVTPTWTVPPSAVMPIAGEQQVAKSPPQWSARQLAASPAASPRPEQPLPPAVGRASATPSHTLAELVATGTASWYDAGPGWYAALPGPWRAGRTVTVCGPAACASAPIVTSCVCGTHVIDLSPSLWERVAGMNTAERWRYGVVSVSIVIEGGAK